MKFKVTITRTSWAQAEFEVEANHEDHASELAAEKAGDHDFGSGNAELSVDDVRELE